MAEQSRLDEIEKRWEIDDDGQENRDVQYLLRVARAADHVHRILGGYLALGNIKLGTVVEAAMELRAALRGEEDAAT